MKFYEYRYKIRYKDTDQMKVVYYSNYLVYMEIGRTELIRSCGTTYREIEEKGFILPVVEAYCKYKASARYDDIINIKTAVEYIKRASIKFAYKILNENGNLLVEGYTIHAVLNEDGKVVPMPFEIKSFLTGYCE